LQKVISLLFFHFTPNNSKRAKNIGSNTEQRNTSPQDREIQIQISCPATIKKPTVVCRDLIKSLAFFQTKIPSDARSLLQSKSE
jgi:hypothetical protein